MYECKEFDHCWHTTRNPEYIVLPDGHITQKCCQCQATRIIHVDHTIALNNK